jgi:hypothetical protein
MKETWKMNYRSLCYAALPALAAALLSAAPVAHAQTVIIAPTAPPPARVETIPAAPSTAMVWQAGHWNWNGANWVWDPGQYVAPPQRMAVWDPGHWVQQPNGGYAWVEGHWHPNGG